MSERERLTDPAWKRWGPYLSERAWGTVREDYSEHGQAWEYFPHDHARSRAYRWSEDGLGGVCDDAQTLCLAFAFWNGRDPVLKERIFGLAGNEGNHGEDAKEYWAYLDSTPTHSWMRWRYLYPQAEFPYGDLVATNRRRGRGGPEYELVDTGVFDGDRYWEVTADYAKAAPDDLCIRLRVGNAGPDEAAVDVLPTLWFRNTWSWGLDDRRPSIAAKDGRLVAEHHALGRMALGGDGEPELLCCENETNKARLWGVEGSTRCPKDGIADSVVHGAATVSPDGTGTKAALRYRLRVPGGGSAEIRLRLAADDADTGTSWEHALTARAAEADAFYAELTPAGATADEALVLRQAFAGMLWSKQFFHCDVDRWLEGDPAGPPPPEARKHGRNAGWRHLNNADVISMPDKWEYPWYAAWDLAFHAVALAHVDPGFAKGQLVLLCREWYMHPNGQLPAYEWAFGDVNPPVHAWAALRVFEIDGCADYEFLERVLHKLLLNFTWWVNRKDAEDSNVFEGGFLGLDNIGPIDRSAPLPVQARLEQSDGTAWMAMYCLNLFEIALVLAEHDLAYEDLATKFFEHFAYIAAAMGGLWDEQDSFYYDALRCAGGGRQPLRVRSLVGLLPLCATTTLGQSTLTRCAEFAGHMRWFLANKPQYAKSIDRTHRLGEHEGRLLAVVDPELRLRPILAVMLDEAEFLSPHGLRSVAASHRERPFTIELAGVTASVGYEPGESTTGLFGGNSNWRGPVWFPVNYLLVEALGRFGRYYGDDFTVEHPTGSGRQLTLAEVADDLAGRLIGIFLDDEHGRRPVFGHYEKFQTDPAWHDLIPFHEYFHGDTGAGLGASHQTGWTGLVADLIMRRRQ
ncbi:MAG: MGH1-like glycoside hydrolase domain-containing protein [Egibacteraceae bacterium]